ncbi:integrase, catalytic region, zinc finger, CCHC-type containing protein [Tanacetum coccineum]
MTTLAEHIIVAGAENRPPMLEKSMYDSWASRIRLFIKGKKHGRMMLDSIDNGPLVYPTVKENRQTRPKKYSKLTEAQQLQDDCDVQATNIILHGLPPDVYALVNHQEAAKDIWDRVKMLMKGTELSYQERECRLYNLFDKFAHVLGETLYEYYWRFSQLINDMHTIGMTMQQVQVNTKFLNALPSEWSKFVTDVKLAKSLYTTNYDQLYAYLSQHERHANEVLTKHFGLLMYHTQQFTPVYAAPIHHPRHHTPVNPQQHPVSPPPFVSPSMTHKSQAEFPQLDYSLIVPMFQQGEYSIECINKAMAFLPAVASRFPPSNNQLRTSSNPRNQATIQDGRVTIQQVQGRQNQSYAGTGNRGIATTSKGNVAAGQPRVVKCYNCQGEGHMARQCTQPKRPRNAAWFKEKLMLAEAQEAGQILDEEQLAFLADPGISEAPVAQQTIPQNSAFQTDDLDAYDSDCDDLSSAKAVLMANLSSCDPEVLSEVPYSDSYPNDMINQDVQEMQYSEQTHVDDFEDNEIHSGSNINPYSQYLQETQDVNHAMNFVIDDARDIEFGRRDMSIKLLDKQNDPISIEKKIKISPSDYSKLNKIKEDFGKCFVTQKELSTKQAFWLKHSSLFEKTVSSHTHVRIEALSELPKASLCSVDKNVFEIQIKQLRIDNDQLLNQIMSQEIVHIIANLVDILDVKKSCMNDCNKCLELETGLFKKKDFIEKEAYKKLVKSYSNLEKHCISLELEIQHNQDIFQRENSNENLNAPSFNQLFEINELKAQSQEKDIIIRKLKERIKSLSGKDSVENVKKDINEIETINIELEHRMFKLDIEPLSPMLKNNRDAHEVYIEKTIEYTDTLRILVESARTQNPSEPLLESACMFTKHVHELLVYVS